MPAKDTPQPDATATTVPPIHQTAMNLRAQQLAQSEAGRQQRLKQLARRNRDVAWLMEQVPSERTPRSAKAPKPAK